MTGPGASAATAALAAHLAGREATFTAAAEGSIRRSLPAPVPPPVPHPWWRPSAMSHGASVQRTVATLTAQSIAAPATIFTRVTERRSLDDERAKVSIARTIEGSPSLNGMPWERALTWDPEVHAVVEAALRSPRDVPDQRRGR